MIEFIKNMRRRVLYYLKYKYKLQKIRKSNKSCYICLESSLHNNLGDFALSYCRHQFLNSLGISDDQIVDFTTPDRMRYWNYMSSSIEKDDILILRGGGFFGDLWLDGFEVILKYIEEFPENKIILFPQSLYFSNTKEGDYWLQVTQDLLSNRPNVYLFARDYNSYLLFKEYFPKNFVSFTPDTVLSYKPNLNVSRNKKRAIICLRSDKEKKVNPDTFKIVKKAISELGYEIYEQDTCIGNNLHNLKDGKKQLFGLWSIFASSGLVITDRLHGMIFSAITSTPCIVFDNVDHKVKNEYQWIRHLKYVKMIDSLDDLSATLNQITQFDDTDYPVEDMLNKYNSLGELLLSLK